MTPLQITLVILLLTIIAFASGEIPIAVISSGIMIALILTGVRTPEEAFSGFINTNVVMFVAMLQAGRNRSRFCSLIYFETKRVIVYPKPNVDR